MLLKGVVPCRYILRLSHRNAETFGLLHYIILSMQSAIKVRFLKQDH